MERSEKRIILLEYFDKGSQFHYNMEGRQTLSNRFRPLGWCSIDEAECFCETLSPLIAYHRSGEGKNILVDSVPCLREDNGGSRWLGLCEHLAKEALAYD